MTYNLGKTFKDVLKIVSLGVMASINGVSSDVFAFENDDQFLGDHRGFRLSDVRDIQGEMSPEDALAAAMAASMIDSQPDFRRASPAYMPSGDAAGGDDLQYVIEASFADQFYEQSYEEALSHALRLSAQEAEGGAVGFADDLPQRRGDFLGLHGRDRSQGHNDEELALTLRLSAQEAQGGADRAPERVPSRGGAYGYQEDVSAAADAVPEKPSAARQLGITEQDPSKLPVRAWAEGEIESAEFHQYISGQIACIYHQLKSKTIHGEIEKLVAQRDEWEGLHVERVGQGIDGKIQEISAEIDQLRMVMRDEPSLEEWTRTVLPEMGRLLRLKNKGIGVAQKIETILSEMF